MNQRKSLKELNLLDKFLFDEAMDDPENVKTMLDIILSQNTNLKHPPQTEKEQRTSIDNRQIRLDVYAIDEDDVIYEVEAQKENTHNLPKRSRLYQGIIDSKLLPPGVVDFNLLNEVLIVLIMPFDLFGYILPLSKLGIWILVSNVAIACIHPRILATFFDSNFVFLSNSNTLQT